jgi:hypothetical protein
MNTNEIKTKAKGIIESKTFRTIIYTMGVIALVFIIFQAGMVAGFRKASFGRDWGDNYATNFGSPHMGLQMMGQRFGDLNNNLPNAHGAIGKIISIDLPTIVVLDEKDNTEKSVLINDKTKIIEQRDIVGSSELKVDDHVIIIGNPNSSGQIEALLIRFLPVPLDIPIKTN